MIKNIKAFLVRLEKLKNPIPIVERFFFLGNFVLLFLLHCGYVLVDASESTVSSLVYSTLIAITQAFSYTLLLYLFAVVLQFLRLTFWLSGVALIGAAGLFSFFLFIDNIIFRLYRFHFNGLVLNVLSGLDGIKSMGLDFSTYLLIGGILVGFFLVQIFIFRLASEKRFISVFSGVRRGPIFLAFFALLLSEKTVFAVADVYNKSSLTVVAKTFPLYFPLFVKKKLGLVSEESETPKLLEKSLSTLNYPTKEVTGTKPKRRYNILKLVIDGWRFDQFSDSVTPYLASHRNDFTYFSRHYSGGNGTRHGVFSLLYGLDSYYWSNFLLERRGPILYDELKELGYAFKILSTTSLNSPEFRSTAFVQLEDSIKDSYDQYDIWKRDAEMVSDFSQFTGKLSKDANFYGFLLFGSTHTSYSFPPNFTKFKPIYPPQYKGQVWTKEHLTYAINSYKNSIFYVDSLIKSIILNLKKQKLYNNTIIIITGDHGEEFFEQGYLGHHSAYTDYQIKVPMLIRHPDYRTVKEVVDRTIHQDVTALLLQSFYQKSDTQAMTSGINPYSKPVRQSILSCSFYDCGILLESGTIVFGTEAHTLLQFDARDLNYKLLDHPQPFINENAAAVSGTLRDISKFLK